MDRIESARSTCLTGELNDKFNNLWHLVGNTPMLELHYKYKGKAGSIYVKCEYYNLTGSIKDRMALYIMYQAYINCQISPGDVVIEASSGNTGIAFAAIGKALGHDVTIIMPEGVSKERQENITSLGGRIQRVSKDGFLETIKRSQVMSEKSRHVFLPKQFENKFNAEAHATTTGPEIWRQLLSIGKMPHAFVAGVGTGGTVMGVGKYLQGIISSIKIHPLEPAESPTLTTGYKVGSHRIQGISDECIPTLVKLDTLDAVVQANDGDAILMAQRLARQLGLAVGVSSGANVVGAIKIKEQLGSDAVVVTMLCDSNRKYLNTDLFKEEPVLEHYVSSQVEFESYQAIGRIAII